MSCHVNSRFLEHGLARLALTRFGACVGLLLVAMAAVPAHAFCGFYVASADTRLYNQASQVVLVRDGPRTVMTLANDFKGNVRDFAMVIPIPTFLQREQIHVTERALIDHLDAYTAPRLVEYFDENPCQRSRFEELAASDSSARAPAIGAMRQYAKSLGVRIEAQYTVGEYDILILSAQQSGGLVTWLTSNGYRIPNGAAPVVASYLKQGMRFFVAKVNLRQQAKSGYSKLRPLQIAYEHRRFMLPIRLGTVNADGPQELFVYGLTRTGRIETTNYRTVALPTDVNLPEFVQPDFANFYRTMFRQQTRNQNGEVVFLEYAWDMAWCDPCAADPLSPAELRELGVFWLDGASQPGEMPLRQPLGSRRPIPSPPITGPVDAFVTRLHVRYDAVHFPEDLLLKTTGNRDNFQGRYVLQRAFSGEADCPEARRYFTEELPQRREQEVQALARLTGWRVADLRRKLPRVPEYRARTDDGARPVTSPGASAKPPASTNEAAPWWRRIWN